MAIKTFWDTLGKEYRGIRSVGLDWEPLSLPVQTVLNGKILTETEFRIIRRSDTMEAIACTSGSWKPLGNKEFEAIASNEIRQMGGHIERGGYLHGAKTAAKTGDRAVFLVSSDLPALGFALFGSQLEVFTTRLFFYNHHCPGRGLGVKVFCVREICSNGLVTTSVKEGLLVAHTASGLDGYRKAKATAEIFAEAIASTKDTFQGLAEHTVSDSEAFEHFVEIEGSKRLSAQKQPLAVKIMQEIYQGVAANLLSDREVNLQLTDYTNHTAYGVLQAMTAYNTHFRPSRSQGGAIKQNILVETKSKSELMLNSLVSAYPPTRSFD